VTCFGTLRAFVPTFRENVLTPSSVTLKMEAARSSETPEQTHYLTRRKISEVCCEIYIGLITEKR